MLLNTIIVALALTAAGDPQPPASSANSGQTRERQICRGGGQRTLGSHIRTTRRCQTAEQWRQEDEARYRPAAGMLITQGQNDGRTNGAPR